MKFQVGISLVISILLIGLPTSGRAARCLVHLPELTEFTVDKSEQIQVIRYLSPLPWVVVEISAGNDTQIFQLLERIRHKGQIYPDVVGHFATDDSMTLPDDEHYNEQWWLSQINVPEMWESTQGEEVTIALLDSGVDPNHPDLTQNILFDQGYDFGDNDAQAYDENGHGTAMAGLMVAQCYNQQGICGISPAAKIIPYKINQHGSGQFFASNLAAAILAAADDSSVKIISLSLVLEEAVQVVKDTLLYAKAQGKIVVAAVGNRGRQPVDYPAKLPWVIGVGAVDANGNRLPSSNYGDGLLISAPGKNLLSTLIGGGYADWFDGSSAATALVSGVLALIVAQQPHATVEEWVVTLLAASQDVEPPGFDSQHGFGVVRVPQPAIFFNQQPEPNLQLVPMTAKVFHYGEQLKLTLNINQVIGRTGDLYLRINFPSNTEKRYTLFKEWNSGDNIEPIPYNQTLISPYWFKSDLLLPLYGTSTALLGMGIIHDSLAEGAYELLAILKLSDNLSISARKIVWITQ